MLKFINKFNKCLNLVLFFFVYISFLLVHLCINIKFSFQIYIFSDCNDKPLHRISNKQSILLQIYLYFLTVSVLINLIFLKKYLKFIINKNFSIIITIVISDKTNLIIKIKDLSYH